MNRLTRTGALAALSAAALLAGCRQDMHNQPKFYPQRGTELFADGRSARPQVANTVARSQMDQDAYFYSGMQGGAEGNTFPMPVTMDLLTRGQERYNIYCTPCHSRVGNGAGMIVQRGYRPAGNFHTDRLRNAPLGHLFSVITNGYGAMPDYAQQLTPEDRWAVVAYIKALQLSQNAGAGDVAGAPTQPIGKIAEDEGLTAAFVHDWNLPTLTHDYGTPNGQDNGIPAQDKVMTPGASTAGQTSGQPTFKAVPRSQEPPGQISTPENGGRVSTPPYMNKTPGH